ncbi:hypothetical protein Q2490_07565 [Myroides odoratimimus]|uniref:hypothetical protein n=1 Tax=Myroides odoratimimus TaxID=76832 RepID=UPI0026DF0518|nr:hypothetical protein [Myroides odoratimimus]MDO5857141.1 hypothetical protein [Myroides odoratimimus]
MRSKSILCLILLGFTVLLSCKNEIKQIEETKELMVKDTLAFKMYNMAPMASLMEEMYAQGVFLKAEIEQGNKELGSLPEKHKDILTAKMTDPSDRDMFFTEQAEQYLKLEQTLYQENQGDKIQQFNDMINSCLACHQKKCGGPIPRIKKLLIQ